MKGFASIAPTLLVPHSFNSKTGEQGMGRQTVSDPQEWAEKYGDFLFRFASVRVREPSAAEELVQETFLAALQAKNRFAGQSTERSWMVGILKHKIVDYFRKTSREQPNFENDLAESGDADLFDDIGHWKSESVGPKEWADPSGAVDRKEFWEAMG